MQTNTTKTCYDTEMELGHKNLISPAPLNTAFMKVWFNPAIFVIVFGAESCIIEPLETDCRMLNKQVHVKRNIAAVQICSIYHQKVTANPLKILCYIKPSISGCHRHVVEKNAKVAVYKL